MDKLELILNNENNLEITTKNCAILGANGCGKTSLSRKIFELNTGKKIQFISAQRNLSFNQGTLKGTNDEELERSTFSFVHNFHGHKAGKGNECIFTNQNSYNNVTQNDFNENIEKIFRDDNNSHSDASRNYNGGNFNPPVTKADNIFMIWNAIFIDKEIKIVDGKISIFPKQGEKYDIENLSDGERSALYLIIKCLYADKNGIIIVDEGESHLNPSLLHELWDSIEKARSDCRFIYISHDINFITSRNNCEKFWIKNFVYPEKWDIEKIDTDNLSEELILQILGSKKEKILFVESKENKDKLLYQNIYIDFKIIPINSCDDVINFTKSLNKASSQKYNKQYFGLIDRDFKNEEGIKKLEKNKIFTLPVAEFENIFFREEIVKFIFDFLGKPDFDKKFKDLKKEIFKLKSDIKFKKDFYKNYIHQEFNKNLANFELKHEFTFKDNYTNCNKLWKEIEEENDYHNFLMKLNTKQISGKSGKLGFKWDGYLEQILNIFHTEKGDEFRKVFLKFMPKVK